MKKIILGIAIIFLFALICGMVFGNILHNYEVRKCNKIIADTNQYYESESNCYMALERPNWNLFWTSFGIGVVNIIIGGLIWFYIWLILNLYY